jgi:hypothetical protein
MPGVPERLRLRDLSGQALMRNRSYPDGTLLCHAPWLRPAEVVGAAGPEAPPSWTKQGRGRLLAALKGETGLVRLGGGRRKGPSIGSTRRDLHE